MSEPTGKKVPYKTSTAPAYKKTPTVSSPESKKPDYGYDGNKGAIGPKKSELLAAMKRRLMKPTTDD